MDLTQVIYSSMLVVFSLLGLIIIASFACSKLSFCDNSTSKRPKKEYKEFTSNAVLPLVRKEVSEQLFTEQIGSPYIPRIKEDWMTMNQARVISDSELVQPINLRNEYEMNFESVINNSRNSLERYSVVESYEREQSLGYNSYSKFSNMSVQYS